MPSEADNSAYIAAGAQLAGQAANIAAAAVANKKGRKWAEERYAVQRNDALTDWHMQNDYNSPAAQMKRYTEAGLNPHLIYGAANNNGPTVRSTDTQSWRPNPPQIDLSGAANSFLQSTNLAARTAQTDNLKAMNANIRLDAILKAGQINQLGVQTAISEQQLSQLKNRAELEIEQLSAGIENTRARTQQTHANTAFTIHQDERNALTSAQNLQKGVLEMANLRTQNSKMGAEIQNLKQNTSNAETQKLLLEADLRLKKAGVQPGDPAWQRAGIQLFDFLTQPEGHKKVANWLNTFDKHLPDWLKVNAK